MKRKLISLLLALLLWLPAVSLAAPVGGLAATQPPAEAAPEPGETQAPGKAPDPDAAFRLLDEVYSLSDPEEQIQRVFEAAKAAPGDADVLINCAQILFYLDSEGKHLDQCEQWLREALKVAKGGQRTSALQLLAEQLVYQDRTDEAAALIRGALEETPRDELLQTTYATVLYYGGKNEEAIAYLEELLEDAPRNMEAARLRAAVLLSEARFDDAMTAYKQIGREWPEYLDGMYGEYQVYVASGQFDRGLRTMDELIRNGGEYGLWLERARIRLWKMYDPEGALSEAEALLRSDPGWIDAGVVKIGSLLMLKENDRAKQAADEIAKEDADYADLLRGVVAMNDDRWQDADTLLKSLSARLPQMYQAEKNRAIIRLMAYDDPEGALLRLSKAFEVDESWQDGDMFVQLGHVYRRQGKLLEAARAYAAADAKLFDDPGALYALVMACVDAGREQDMLDMLAEMERKYPGWYETMLARTLVEDILDHREEAVQAFDAMKQKFPFAANDLTGLEGALRARAGLEGASELVKTWLSGLEEPGAEDVEAYAYALLCEGDLKGAREALEKAEALVPEAVPENASKIADAWIMIETCRAELLLAEGDLAGCVAALEKAASYGWPVWSLAVYPAFQEVYASQAYQALLDTLPAQPAEWDLSQMPKIP